MAFSTDEGDFFLTDNYFHLAKLVTFQSQVKTGKKLGFFQMARLINILTLDFKVKIFCLFWLRYFLSVE